MKRLLLLIALPLFAMSPNTRRSTPDDDEEKFPTEKQKTFPDIETDASLFNSHAALNMAVLMAAYNYPHGPTSSKR